jgi:hypothetical protein
MHQAGQAFALLCTNAMLSHLARKAALAIRKSLLTEVSFDRNYLLCSMKNGA